jgi:hypothetical protein
MVADFLSRVKRAGRASVSSKTRLVSSFILSGLVFLLLAFTTALPWHLQTLGSGVAYWDNALYNSITSVYLGGVTSLLLTLSYSLISGMVLTNFGVQLLEKNFAGRELGGILPGFVATGCASCGVGFTAFLGITGASIAPFGGDLFKLGGITLLIYAMYSLGDPDICRI